MNLLLLAYYFPPQRNGGVGRPWSLFRYLPEHDIDVTVITTEEGGSLPPESEKNRVVRLPSDNRMCYRDLGWEKEALSVALSLAPQRNFDCVYATFPLASTLAVGSKIKYNLGIPFIAEFRDGLTVESLFQMYEKILKLAEPFEAGILKMADRVVTVTSGLAYGYKKKYGIPVYQVYNGFDPEDFNLVSERKIQNERHEMALFGSILASRSTNARISSYVNFLGAIKILKSKNFINKNNFSLSFIGPTIPFEHDMVNHFQLHDIILFKPSMTKNEGLAWLTSSFDSLLHYGSPGEDGMVCSKLLEYLNLKMPIFGICKGNESADIIHRTRTGMVCGFDLGEVTHGLINFLNGDYLFDPNLDQIEKFNREKLASRIATIIKDLIIPNNSL